MEEIFLAGKERKKQKYRPKDIENPRMWKKKEN